MRVGLSEGSSFAASQMLTYQSLSSSSRKYKMHRIFSLSRGRRSTDPVIQTIPIAGGGHTRTIMKRTESKTEYELTSIRICQLLERKKYQKVVDILRETSCGHILKCLESFPFKALNKGVPDSFPIWETLLIKLHNVEEGYIAQVPNTAYNELVVRIAYILSYLERDPKHDQSDLFSQCRRVLKKVYMQYHEIIDNLLTENEKLSRVLYSLTLHIPLGTDALAVTLQQAVYDEVNASLIDFKDAIERLEDLTQHDISHQPESPTKNGFSMTRNCSQREIQERLYFNQCVVRSVTPCKRKDNLDQLLEMLGSRIQGDKDVLALFAGVREHNDHITESEPVEPWLRHYQHSIECAITLLREIESELAIKSPSSSPPGDKIEESISPDLEPLTVFSVSSVSLDHDQFPTLAKETARRHSISHHRSSSEKLLLVRPMSANLMDTSSSDQDISAKSLNHPLQKTQSPIVLAGMKKKPSLNPLRRSLRNSMRRLSSSTGNMSSKSKRLMARSSSGGKSSDDDVQLEITKRELLDAREKIQSLRRRERELTDRLSETAQRHLQDSERFEDILMGANRPSLVVQRYQELYSQERIEAYDAITDIEGLDDIIFIPEFLLDILKCSYNAAQCSLASLHKGWKRSLGIKESYASDERSMAAVRQLESAVSVYIRKMSSSFDIQDIVNMTHWDLEKRYSSLPFFHLIIKSPPVLCYIEECAKLGWDLVIQNPPMVLNYRETDFSPELHTRFHSADSGSEVIICYQWPTLIHQTSGAVLIKGIVIT